MKAALENATRIMDDYEEVAGQTESTLERRQEAQPDSEHSILRRTDYMLLKGIDAFEKSGHSTDPGDWRDGLLSIRRSLRQRLGEIDSPAPQSQPMQGELQPQV